MSSTQSNRWYNKLFGCTKHKKVCLISTFIPCGLHYLHSVAVEAATSKSTSFQVNFVRTEKISYIEAFLLDLFCCCCINRYKVRQAYEIKGSFCQDILAYMCCPLCAGIQDINEINDREVDFEQRYIFF